MQLIAACGLLFVASLPNALREARALAIDDPVARRGGGASLRLCRAGAAPRLRARRAGPPGGPRRSAGAAAFSRRGRRCSGRCWPARRWRWRWRCSASPPRRRPPALCLARGCWLAALAFWLWLFAASLAEAEGFAATGRVAAVLVAAFAGGSRPRGRWRGGGPAPAGERDARCGASWSPTASCARAPRRGAARAGLPRRELLEAAVLVTCAGMVLGYARAAA